uniref:Uncharacterized protein n=1 Tax=Cacopsylla melanoneura TaxID=428564 RepID=A0A8D8QH88_9HEMI
MYEVCTLITYIIIYVFHPLKLTSVRSKSRPTNCIKLLSSKTLECRIIFALSLINNHSRLFFLTIFFVICFSQKPLILFFVIVMDYCIFGDYVQSHCQSFQSFLFIIYYYYNL